MKSSVRSTSASIWPLTLCSGRAYKFSRRHSTPDCNGGSGLCFLNAAMVPFHADLAFVLLSVDKSVKETTQRALLAQKKCFIFFQEVY